MERVWLDFERPIQELEAKVSELEDVAAGQNLEVDEDLSRLRTKAERMTREIYSKLSPWNKVQVARHPQRPYTLDYVRMIADSFFELHGDRCYADDHAIVGGMASIDGRKVMIVGHQKGRDTKENIHRNFGMPHPEGYRKALRLMQMAARCGRPVVTFIDTPGAYPGVGAEERGQAEAIARNLREMAELPVPILVFIVGEGGSGGALALGVGDRILMLEHAIYSVISPEGCASILWKDRSKAKEAANALKLTATDIEGLGIADRIVEEPLGGAHRDHAATAVRVKEALIEELDELTTKDIETLIRDRLEKYRRMGRFKETSFSLG
jgi:acetyl-CoA carboxylase carboxyl transferase subunit alpha